ncbi:discoidin domain-containing protein [Paenibacillus elgii]|uniref:discoidin domain-containing protein n=1 Tax=Paenibacillus elgii TaxID=189691 RepID=UPI00203D47D7|nr:discoidin domain-containing protein [Paenibacillus elgii]MCM3274310.1 discoidin domain-containing protein [Paenibacillus elgii]
MIYFVDGINGLDTQSGISKETPLKTLSKALSSIVSGDEIRLVPNSTYTIEASLLDKNTMSYTLRSIDDTLAVIKTTGNLTFTGSTTNTKNFSYIEFQIDGLWNTSDTTSYYTFNYTNCKFIGQGDGTSSGFWCNCSNRTFTNCVFMNFKKDVTGGHSILINRYGNSTVTNCTFFNSLSVIGTSSGGNVVLSLCIFDTATKVNNFSLSSNYIRDTVQNKWVDGKLYGASFYITRYLIEDDRKIMTLAYDLGKIDTTGVIASASTTYQNNVASNVIDGKLSTGWGSASGSPQWLHFDFGANRAVKINQFEFYGTLITAWKFWGSIDGVNYTLLHSFPAQPPVISTEKSRTFKFTNDTYFRYYKFTDINRDNVNWMSIYEIIFFGMKAVGWKTLDLPLTKELFNENSVNIQEINRSIQVVSREMVSDKIFSNGKTFSSEIDLNKFIDIKKISIS